MNEPEMLMVLYSNVLLEVLAIILGRTLKPEACFGMIRTRNNV